VGRSIGGKGATGMLGLPWWVWVVVGPVAVYRLGLLAMSKGFRLIARNEFLQFVFVIPGKMHPLGLS
jgi:hypothetical protein